MAAAPTKAAPDPPRKRKEPQKRQPSVTRHRRSWASRFGGLEVLRLIFINFTNKKKVERTFQAEDSHRVLLFKQILFMASKAGCKLEFRTLCSTALRVTLTIEWISVSV